MKNNRNRILIGGLSLILLLSAACGNRADRTYRQGLRLARQKKYDQAVGEMRRLLQMEPESARARNALGRIYRVQNSYSRAIEELTLAVEVAGDDPVPAYNLGGVYWDLEEMEEAARCYRLSLDIDPRFAPALFRLGAVRRRQGKTEEAAEYFRAFLQTAPEDPAPGHNNLGVLLWEQGDRAAALREFAAARKTGSSHPEILYNFGVGSLLLDGRNRRGVEALLDYFRVRPDGRERMELKRLLEKSNRVVATETGLFTRDDYLRQGEAYESAGQYHPAEQEYRRALDLDPASAEAHYRLGRIYDRFLGEGEKAVSHYESFLTRRPRSPSAGEVIARLGELRPPLSAAAPAATPRTPVPSSPPPASPRPPDPEEYCRRGERLAAEGAFDRSAAAFRQCLEASPDSLPALIGLGNALLSGGEDYPGAETALLRARELNPGAPVKEPLGRVYILRGAAELASGHFEESVEFYRRARAEGLTAEADEGLWKAHHNHYRHLRETGDYPAAARQLEKSLELRPEVEEDYIELAEFYGKELSRSDRAGLYFRRYLELFPRGKLADRARQGLRPAPSPPAPAAPSRAALRPAPAPGGELSATEHYNRGAVHQREGRYAPAREEYLKAIRRRPGFYQAFYNLGLVYHQEGRPDQALAAFKEAARLNPDFPQAQLSLFNLYYYHYRMKNLARPHGLRYIELAPDTPQARELRRGLGI